MRFLISAGEASGELYGAGIIDALRERVPGSEFFGVGGKRMRDVGFETIVDAHRISVVGLAEVVSHLPMIRREFQRIVGEATKRKPDVAILIDFPDFNLRLARELHKLGIPVVYYVSPQLWAWRQGRIKQVQKYVRKMLVIFPFEVDFYRKHGVDAEYVGHPIADEPLPNITREHFAKENNLDPARTWIALLPGSRRKEVLLNLPRTVESATLLSSPDREFVLPVASSLREHWIQHLISQASVRIHLVHDARTALRHARAAVVASGTATVEAALIGTPFVMIYRVTPLTYAVGRRLVKLTRFGMVNLIAGREVVPEFIQDNFTPNAVATHVRQLLGDTPERQRMLNDLAEVRQKLHPQGNLSAAQRAASAVLSLLQQ